ncbi:MAG TPA: OFA family MFS transporter [Anaerohalosphaeraceae bacterium]|nr:OFA family MFS transporter [Anaerohalosphaeraceae bacterium]
MKNRWLIAASAVGIHISIGSVYAWSIFTRPMMADYGWALEQVNLTFSIAIFFLGLSAAFLGRFVEFYGPRKAGITAAVLFCSGLLLSALACKLGHLGLLYLGYGVLGGIGIGIGYITPISTLIKWFPDKKGLATGIAIMGFGFASVIFRLIAPAILEHLGISAVFYSFAGFYCILIVASALYLAPPPESFCPASGRGSEEMISLTPGQAIKTVPFYCLWVMFFINITCGIAVISVASPMTQDIAGLSPEAAATLVAILGLFNGLGRFGWSSLSDVIGRPAVWIVFFIIQLAAFMMISHLDQPVPLQILLCLIITCYGGGFASMPAFITDIFGAKYVSAILGFILTAWSAAGIAGPILISRIRQSTGSYQHIFTIFSAMLIVGLVIAVLLKLTLKTRPIKP